MPGQYYGAGLVGHAGFARGQLGVPVGRKRKAVSGCDHVSRKRKALRQDAMGSIGAGWPIFTALDAPGLPVAD